MSPAIESGSHAFPAPSHYSSVCSSVFRLEVMRRRDSVVHPKTIRVQDSVPLVFGPARSLARGEQTNSTDRTVSVPNVPNNFPVLHDIDTASLGRVRVGV